MLQAASLPTMVGGDCARRACTRLQLQSVKYPLSPEGCQHGALRGGQDRARTGVPTRALELPLVTPDAGQASILQLLLWQARFGRGAMKPGEQATSESFRTAISSLENLEGFLDSDEPFYAAHPTLSTAFRDLNEQLRVRSIVVTWCSRVGSCSTQQRSNWIPRRTSTL